MKCTVCDRCKKVIDDQRRIRVVTLSKPIKPPPCTNGGKTPPPPRRGNDPQFNDILFEKDLCQKCAEELEEFLEPVADAPSDPGATGQPTENPSESENEENASKNNDSTSGENAE